MARLKEAASKVTEWSNPGEEQAMTARKKEVDERVTVNTLVHDISLGDAGRNGGNV